MSIKHVPQENTENTVVEHCCISGRPPTLRQRLPSQLGPLRILSKALTGKGSGAMPSAAIFIDQAATRAMIPYASARTFCDEFFRFPGMMNIAIMFCLFLFEDV